MKVIIAARLSTLHKNGQGIGIETQDELSREWAEREGHEVIDVVADTKRGTVPPWDRKNLKPWVTDPGKMALYDGIVAFKNDRLSRGAWDDETRIRQWAEEHGKTLLIVDGPQWPPRHDGDFWSWTAQAKQARAEWEEIRERSLRSTGKLRREKKLLGRAPFGYEEAGEEYDRRLVPTVTGRIVVPWIFKWAIDGDSLSTIVNRLIALEVPSTSGVWWPGSVRGILLNATFCGRHKQNEFKRYTREDEENRVRGADGKLAIYLNVVTGADGEPIVKAVHIHECEALVDEDTFTRAGKAIARRTAPEPVNPDNRALLSRILFCARCGLDNSPMYRVNTGYYRCAGRGNRRKGCGNLVSVTETDELVNSFMEGFSEPILESRKVPGASHAAAIEAVEMDLRDLAALGLSEDAEDAKRMELRAERKRLQALAKEAVPDAAQWIDTGRTYNGEWATLTGQQRGDFLRQRGITVYAVNADIASLVQPVWARKMAPRAAVVWEGEHTNIVVSWRYRARK